MANSQAETHIQTAFERINAPSMIGAIIHQGQLQFVLESGDATRASRFRLGTLTQPLTAYAILQHLSPEQLHQPITTWLKSFTIQSPTPITPHHLLTHTSGLGAGRSLWALIKNDTVQSADKPIYDLNKHYNGVLKAQVSAGEKWCYSHDNYAVLGQILADIHGKPYETVMQETVYNPFGMTATFNAPTLDGYKTDRRTVLNQKTPLLASLGACASLDDLIQWLGASFETPALTTPHYQTHAQLPAMGYSLRTQIVNQIRLAWINGEVAGFSGALCLAPDSQTAVILLANTQTEGLLGSVARQAVMDVLALTPTKPESAPLQPNQNLKGYFAPTAGLLTNIEVWNAYGGGLTIHQKGQSPKIAAQIDPTVSRPLHPTANPNLYYFVSAKDQPSWLAVDFDPVGNAERLHIGLFTFHSRPHSHSLGGKLIIVILLLLALFFMIVLSIL